VGPVALARRRRRHLGVAFVAAAIGATACGAGAAPIVTVRAAASKTSAVSTASVVETVTTASGPLAHGATFTGAFDFTR